MKDEKYWELPEEILNKWIAALESGKYFQGQGKLAEVKDHMCLAENITPDTAVTHCCLGVYCSIINIPFVSICNQELPNALKDISEIDNLLLEECNGSNLITLLVGLNDGLSPSNFKSISKDYPKIDLSFLGPIKKSKEYSSASFTQIAEILRKHVKPFKKINNEAK